MALPRRFQKGDIIEVNIPKDEVHFFVKVLYSKITYSFEGIVSYVCSSSSLPVSEKAQYTSYFLNKYGKLLSQKEASTVETLYF